uniref:Uncharacterized protein n=1 Tax=Caenorhabditis japonica TaxID=281687 RepID=A0A8R1IP91_CAEJA
MNKYVTRSDIDILNTRIEISQKVKYLGRTFADDGSLTEEVARRIRAGWAAFNAIRRELLQSPQKIRIRLLTTTVIPAMTYGCETWTSKEADTKRLQRAVSNMFEIAGCDPPDMEKQVLRRKLKWAGHVSRMKYDRWAKIVSEWDPRGSARPRGRPPKRWADDITDSIKSFIHNEALRGNLGHDEVVYVDERGNSLEWDTVTRPGDEQVSKFEQEQQMKEAGEAAEMFEHFEQEPICEEIIETEECSIEDAPPPLPLNPQYVQQHEELEVKKPRRLPRIKCHLCLKSNFTSTKSLVEHLQKHIWSEKVCKRCEKRISCDSPQHAIRRGICERCLLGV